ncbi:hypothetical protein ABIF96_002764 [Bradyrhizobium ottawaense]
MSLARRLLAQVDVHDGRAGIERSPGFARHLLGRHGDIVLLRVGEHAVQRAGDDGLVAHALDVSHVENSTLAIMGWAACGFLRGEAGKHDEFAGWAKRSVPTIFAER